LFKNDVYQESRQQADNQEQELILVSSFLRFSEYPLTELLLCFNASRLSLLKVFEVELLNLELTFLDV